MADRGKILFATVGTGNIEDLEKTLLIPLKKPILKGESSEYGYRTHPTLGYRKLHAGQDMGGVFTESSCFSFKEAISSVPVSSYITLLTFFCM